MKMQKLTNFNFAAVFYSPGLRSVIHRCSTAMQQFALSALLQAPLHAADVLLQNLTASAKWA